MKSLLKSKILKAVEWVFPVALIILMSGSYTQNAEAGGIKYVPIILSDITVIIPVQQIDCLPSNTCITWVTQTTNVIQTTFTNDLSFNYADDTNKVHQINTLYYFSQSPSSIRLQCVVDSSGNWADVASSTGESSLSVINTVDSNGQPQNINYGALAYPAYQHKWPGSLLVNAKNCLPTTTNLYAPVTNDYTYTHTQKSFTLRMLNPDGSVAFLLPPLPAADTCRVNDGAPNLWQRTLDCVGSSRPTSMVMAVDESITQVTNWRNAAFAFNTHLNGPYAISNDIYKCNLMVSVDGATPQPVATDIDSNQAVIYQRLHTGTHVLSITVSTDSNGNACYTYNDAYGPNARCNTSPNSCTSNTAYFINPSNGYFPSILFNVNTQVFAPQNYPFSIQ